MELEGRPSSRSTGQAGPQAPRSFSEENHLFNDFVTTSGWLNSFLIRSNMFCGHLYRNVINAPLMSTKSHQIKARLRQLESLKNDEQQIVGRKSSGREQQSAVDSRSRWQFWSHRSSRSSGPLTLSRRQRRRRHQTTGGKSKSAGALKLRLPKRNDSILIFMLLLELVVIMEFAYITYYLSDSYPKVQLLTCTRPKGTLKYEVIKFERYINLSGASAIAPSGASSCLDRMELQVNELFGEFYVWQASIGLDQRNASGRLFNDEAHRHKYLHDEFFIYQLIRKEIRLYHYLIACFLLSCLAGSLIADRVPYDITPLVLIYDPQFVANTINLRLSHYLDLMRHSYMNYWAAHCLNETTNELVARDNWAASKCCAQSGSEYREHDTSSQASSQVEIVDSQSLSYNQFTHYRPTARSQSWRRVLIFWHPILVYGGMLVVTGSIVGVWLMFFQLNVNGAQVNLELQSFLLNTQHRYNNSELATLEAQCRDQLDMDLIRSIIARQYAQSLRQHSEQLYKLKRMDYLNSTYPNSNHLINQMPLDETAIELQIVANTLGPLEQTPAVYFILPTLTVLLPCLLASLYLVILFITLWDLCISIVELRLKLNICSAILNHYQNFKINIHQQRADSPKAPANNRNTFLSYSPDRITTTTSKSSLTESNFLNFDQHNHCFSKRKHLDGSIGMLFYRLSSSSFPRISNKKSQRKDSNDFDCSTSLCNIDLSLLFVFLMANRKERQLIIETYAKEIINLDLIDSLTPRKATEKFLTTTYLDFRLFLDQVEDCRNSINFLIGYTVGHSLNIIAASASLTGIWIQFGFLLFGFFLANLSFLGGGFFQSQCSKLYAPIHSLIASCIYGDKVINHLASLWRRSLIDLCGLRSKLSFRVYSLSISYALALKFNLSVVSIYIIILDRATFR